MTEKIDQEDYRAQLNKELAKELSDIIDAMLYPMNLSKLKGTDAS